MVLKVSTSLSKSSSEIAISPLNSANYPLPTPTSASSGHSVNQSKVQLFTKEGNILNLVLNIVESGLIAITKWMLFLTRFKYCEKMFIFVG